MLARWCQEKFGLDGLRLYLQSPLKTWGFVKSQANAPPVPALKSRTLPGVISGTLVFVSSSFGRVSELDVVFDAVMVHITQPVLPIGVGCDVISEMTLSGEGAYVGTLVSWSE